MIFALDCDSIRINAMDAIRGADYFCPGCKSRMVLKQGEINIPHFAHPKNRSCADLFTENKMTEWHLNHQKWFSEDCREVILKADGKKHIADVKKGNLIVEFQHSPIKNSVFEERTDFYNKFGNVMWIFDRVSKFENNSIIPYQYNRKTHWKWMERPDKMLGKYDFKKLLSDGVHVFLQISDKPTNIYLLLTWNDEGMKYFTGDLMNDTELHDYMLSYE